jgi:small conductance mechanosensitive channel
MDFYNLSFETFQEKISRLIVEFTPRVIFAILAILIGLWIIKYLAKGFNGVLKKSKVDETLFPFFSSLVNIGLKLFLFITIAGSIGIQTTSFFAVLASAFFAVGLALQGSLSNLASGVMIFLFKPFKVHDIITVGENTGRVEEILIFNTIIIDDMQKLIFVPNSTIMGGVVKNYSGRGKYIHKLLVPIKHGIAFDTVKLIMEEAIKNAEDIKIKNSVDIICLRMEQRVYWIELSVICEWNDKDLVANKIYRTIQSSMLEHNIKIGEQKSSKE